jgi:hypothetical protein
MFFGDPFTVAVRDAVPPEEERSILATSGILYVREAAPGEAAPGSRPNATDKIPPIGGAIR